MSTGPLLHSFCFKVSSLTRSNAMWNIMMVDKAFSKSTDGNFGRNIACREGKSDPEYLFQYEQNTDPFMIEVVINLHQVAG